MSSEDAHVVTVILCRTDYLPLWQSSGGAVCDTASSLWQSVLRDIWSSLTLPERTLVRTAVPYHQEGHGRPWEAHLTFR